MSFTPRAEPQCYNLLIAHLRATLYFSVRIWVCILVYTRHVAEELLRGLQNIHPYPKVYIRFTSVRKHRKLNRLCLTHILASLGDSGLHAVISSYTICIIYSKNYSSKSTPLFSQTTMSTICKCLCQISIISVQRYKLILNTPNILHTFLQEFFR